MQLAWVERPDEEAKAMGVFVAVYRGINVGERMGGRWRRCARCTRGWGIGAYGAISKAGMWFLRRRDRRRLLGGRWRRSLRGSLDLRRRLWWWMGSGGARSWRGILMGSLRRRIRRRCMWEFARGSRVVRD